MPRPKPDDDDAPPPPLPRPRREFLPSPSVFERSAYAL